MVEYTKDDIIMFPDDPRANEAIGKGCYFEDSPLCVLDLAIKSGKTPSFLSKVDEDSNFPFIDEDGDGFACIIIEKEEPKPEYVPFESKEEFLDAYIKSAEENLIVSSFESKISLHGIWLRDIPFDAYSVSQIAQIYDDGVRFCNNDTYVTWEKLLKYMTFLDKSPCGKKSKVDGEDNEC